jgi:hypothetical protein
MKLATIFGPLAIGLDYDRDRYVPANRMDQALPPFFNPVYPPNVGDWFITKATERLLDYDELLIVTPEATPDEWDYINDVCDALVIKGGNYIQENGLLSQLGLSVFEKVTIPIILFGAGVQGGIGDDIPLTGEEVEILRYIHSTCACSAIRGRRTGEALADLGIDNVSIIGCPTLFWQRKEELQVRPPTDESVAFSFRQSLYSSDPAMNVAQFRAIELLRDAFRSVTVMLQGEEVPLQYYFQVRNWGAEYRGRVVPIPGTNLLRQERSILNPDDLAREIHARFDGFSRPEFVDWLMANTFFSWDISDYLDEFRTKGMVVGCRFHGNLLALAHEAPTFYLTYDERTQELAELLEIPHCEVREFGRHINLLEQDWRPFEERYRQLYAEMLDFLERNNLKHTLPSSRATVAAT